MINPSVEHNQRLPYQNSGAFHADSPEFKVQDRRIEGGSLCSVNSITNEIGVSTFKLSSLKQHCSVIGS